jgi:hypothetical protein
MTPEQAQVMRERAELGIDIFDEVWDGEPRFSPAPHCGCQDIVAHLVMAFEVQAKRHGLAEVMRQVNLRQAGTGETNYRIPDIVAIPLDKLHFVATGWVEGGASLVCELRTPREKLGARLEFFAERGVPEVLYCDWRTLRFEVLRPGASGHAVQPCDPDGAGEIRALDLRIRRVLRDGCATLEFEDMRGGGQLPSVQIGRMAWL